MRMAEWSFLHNQNTDLPFELADSLTEVDRLKQQLTVSLTEVDGLKQRQRAASDGEEVSFSSWKEIDLYWWSE